MEISKEQWEQLEECFPSRDKFQVGRGRPRVDTRQVMEGVLWKLNTGSPWKDLPPQYPPYQTCHRRYKEWLGNGVFERVIDALKETHDISRVKEVSEAHRH